MVCSELYTKIGKREETMCVVESLLVFAVAAFYFAVVAGCVGADQLVPDSKTCGGQLKACEPVLLVGRKTVGKLNTIVCLHALYPHTTVFEPCHHFLQEISGRVSALFWICAQIAKACIFVDCRILV